MDLSLFNTANLFEASTHLFQQLGIKLNSNTAEALPTKKLLSGFYKDNDTFNSIINTYFIGIIDDSVFQTTGKGDVKYSIHEVLHPDFHQDDNGYNGLMIFAFELTRKPTRTEISELTRAFNRISQKMPVALLLKYPSVLPSEGNEALISLAISERFKYLQHWRQGEKVGKIIILKDIATYHTHAGHQRILLDLVKPSGVTNFKQLHAHWLQVLDVNVLNKKFFKEIANWYFWAKDKVQFPDDIEKNEQVRNATNLIRLITRIIFIWFIKEKNLVPAALFDKKYLSTILKDFMQNKNSDNYYKAILQNLFFGTLNQKMNERKFAKDDNIQTNRTEYGVKNLYRYANLFKIPEQEVLNLFKDIPFLNGGLFDCLDKPNDEDKIIYVDGFSRNAKKQAHVPDYLFFDDGQETKLNETYQTSNNSYNCKGLINLLESYKFTVAENTPLEEEIALDPELLGKVFEELLANYNPETQTTARKQTGSFYTPREIVDYMVDESLLEYLKGALSIPADGEDDNDRFSAHEFFNPNNEIQIHQGNLPHWQQENVWYFVTFRLADSIPTEVAEQIKVEREIWLKNNSKNPNSEYSKEQLKEYNRLFSDRVEKLLNDYHGSCILKNKEIANIVKNAIENFNNQRYLLDEWVIMPNHVHILVKPLAENKLSDILHSWKSFTANEINKALNKKGQVWMHESYDHIVRNERAFRAIRNYIRQNPVKAKLAEGEFLISESKAERSKDTSATLEQRLRDLLSYSENSNPFNEAETQQLIAAINNCKILDPACGSGAFPMGILHKMVHILQKIDPNNKKWKAQQKEKIIGDQIKQLENDKKAIEGLSDKAVREKAIQAVDERLKEIREIFESKNYFDDYARKLYLIENCIYGIDIQPIAVQIAKLRFFISLIIDQDKDPTQENLGFRSLPNLETKFVAANTLIGLDKPQQFAIRNPQIDETEKQLKQLRHEYFTANTRKKKLKLQAKDKNLRKQIAELLKNDGWPSLVAEQISSFDPYDQNHFANWFDPEWMFGHDLKNGFDIVIGNPPYIQLQKAFNYKNKYADLYKDQNYKTFDRTGDIYCLFYEKGIQLLKENGLLAYITSNKWMRAGYGEKLREFFIKHKPLQLVDLGPGVFQNATVDTNILIIQKFASRVSAEVSSPSKDASDTLAVTLQKEDKDDITKALTEKGVRLTKLTKDAWFIGSDAEQKLKAKIEKIGKPLKEWDVKIYRGVLTGLNKAFIITTEKRDEILNNCQDEDERIRTEAIIKPILRGRDIKRYHYQWAGLWVIFIPWHFPLHEDLTIQGTSEKAEKEFQKKYPSIYHHLLQFKDALSKRNKEETGIRYEWYAMQRCAATYYPEFEKEKVAFKAVGKNLTFSLFKPGTMISAPASFMTSNFNKYILGLLCSSFTFYFVLKNADKTGAGDVMLNVQSFQKIPLPPITSTTEPIVNQIEALVDKILEAKKQNPEADTRQREKEIDQLVYKLYDLTEEEIKIIEGGE